MAAAAEVLDLPLDDIGEVSPLPVPPTRATRRRMRSCYVVRWPSFSSNTVSATDQYFSFTDAQPGQDVKILLPM